MTTAPTSSQPPSLFARALRAWKRIVRWGTRQPRSFPIHLIILSLVGLLFLLFVIAPVIFVGDWLWSWQLTRLWAQVTGACTAFLLAGWAIHGTNLNRITRIVLLIGTLVLMLTLVDSLDGQQDAFTDIVFITSLWSCFLAVETYRIARDIPAGIPRRKIGLGVGIAATLLFAGSAIVYALYNVRVAPLRYDHHVLYLLGIIISGALRWIQPTKSATR